MAADTTEAHADGYLAGMRDQLVRDTRDGVVHVESKSETRTIDSREVTDFDKRAVALQHAVSLGGYQADAAKVVEAAQKLYDFLSDSNTE